MFRSRAEVESFVRLFGSLLWKPGSGLRPHTSTGCSTFKTWARSSLKVELPESGRLGPIEPQSCRLSGLVMTQAAAFKGAREGAGVLGGKVGLYGVHMKTFGVKDERGRLA